MRYYLYACLTCSRLYSGHWLVSLPCEYFFMVPNEYTKSRCDRVRPVSCSCVPRSHSIPRSCSCRHPSVSARVGVVPVPSPARVGVVPLPSPLVWASSPCRPLFVPALIPVWSHLDCSKRRKISDPRGIIEY